MVQVQTKYLQALDRLHAYMRTTRLDTLRTKCLSEKTKMTIPRRASGETLLEKREHRAKKAQMNGCIGEK